MALINSIGKSLKKAAQGERASSIGVGLLGAGITVQGAYHGADTGGQLTQDFYDTFLGTPEADNAFFGRDIGPGGVLDAQSLAAQSAVGSVGGFVFGGAAGGYTGSLIGRRLSRSGNPTVKTAGYIARASGAILGATVGAGIGSTVGRALPATRFVNSTTAQDYSRYRNHMPYVPGDVVFGAYNMRHA